MARNVCLSRRAERLFILIPTSIAVLFGLGVMLTRFVVVLRDSLLEGPADWRSFLLLTVLVGSVSLIIVGMCAAIGMAVGLVLRALFGARQTEAYRL